MHTPLTNLHPVVTLESMVQEYQFSDVSQVVIAANADLSINTQFPESYLQVYLVL